MFLIVGLGNPGKQYELTRHNAGFIAVDILSGRYNCFLNYNAKFDAEIASGFIGSQKVILCKPSTFMNLSAKSVGSIMSFYKIELNHVIIIHDDIDLDLGQVKYKFGGGNAGHRGLRSVDQSFGRDYHRIRIGIGRPSNERMDVADFVLANFTSDEQKSIINEVDSIASNIGLIMENKIEEFKKALS